MRLFKMICRNQFGFIAGLVSVMCAFSFAAAAPNEQTAVFAGGQAATAHYEQVSKGDTGHAESVRIRFDPNQISYQQLLKVFFIIAHDPTQLNRQGPDVGSQYRSVIFYNSEEQRTAALNYIRQLSVAHTFSSSIVTRLVPLQQFYPAEGYHQNYLELHPGEPYIIMNDLPKLIQLREKFPAWYR